MRDGTKPSGGRSSNAQFGRWHVAWIFLLIWFACWLAKIALLDWLVLSPLVGLGLKLLSFSEPGEVFVAYLQLTGTAALIAVLPLLARLAYRHGRVPVGFVGISYAVLLLAVVSTHFVLAPMFTRWLIPPESSSARAPIALDGLTTFLAKWYLFQAAAAQVLTLAACRRVHHRSGVWAIIRWLVIGLACIVLAVLLTPPNMTHHYVLLSTWAGFWGTAKLGRRFVHAGGPIAIGPVAERVSDPSSSNPYEPPAGG